MSDSAVTALVLSFTHNQNQEMLFMTDSYSFKPQALPLAEFALVSV